MQIRIFFQGWAQMSLAHSNFFSSLLPSGSNKWDNSCLFSTIVQANGVECSPHTHIYWQKLPKPSGWTAHFDYNVQNWLLLTYKFIQSGVVFVTQGLYSVSFTHRRQSRSHFSVRFLLQKHSQDSLSSLCFYVLWLSNVGSKFTCSLHFVLTRAHSCQCNGSMSTLRSSSHNHWTPRP